MSEGWEKATTGEGMEGMVISIIPSSVLAKRLEKLLWTLVSPTLSPDHGQIWYEGVWYARCTISR